MPAQIRPLFGLEFEVSFTTLDTCNKRVNSGRILQKFLHVAGTRFAHLPAHESSGIFLGNGGRLYLDCGKPEITTPEVMTPTDACRYSLAGENILLDVSRAVVDEVRGVQEIILSRNNVSYGGCCNSWACHESYGHRIESRMADHFIPHAVSRIIYTGAGGFDSRTYGIRFLVSPRVAHLHAAVSDNTQRNRGIFNTKNETLNRRGYNRLHVICGENVSSVLSQWLKIATTAVVVAMIEAGLRPGDGLALRDPLQAMRTFAEDVTLTATATTTSGESLTALDIQRRLLEKAQRLSVSGAFQDWLPHCCRLWEEILDRLQQGPAAVQRSIDWAIKLELFRDFAQRRGITWDRLMRWDGLLRKLDEIPWSAHESFEQIQRISNQNERILHLAEHWKGSVRERGLDWDELREVLALRQQLFEIDSRFGEMGQRGIFNALDAGGHLQHQVEGVDNIAQAMTDPPTQGRARLRGRVIQMMSQAHAAGGCEWSAVWDYSGYRMLDLSDPFAEEESWTPLPESPEVDDENRERRLARAFEHAVKMYDRGDYESAQRMLHMVEDWLTVSGVESLRDCHRFSAWIQAHRGFTDGATWLDNAYRTEQPSLAMICDYLLVFRFQGLIPGPEFRSWCDQGFQLLSGPDRGEPKDRVALRCSRAFDLLCRGDAEDAWNAYHDNIPSDWMYLLHPRFYARILTEKAEVLRRLGRTEESLSLLIDAQRLQADQRYNGDIADLTLTQKAKILAQDNEVSDAWSILEEAARVQRAAANVVGEARTLLLMARLHTRVSASRATLSLDDLRLRFMQICITRPALSACKLANTILENWDLWVKGRRLGRETDPFWRL